MAHRHAAKRGIASEKKCTAKESTHTYYVMVHHHPPYPKRRIDWGDDDDADRGRSEHDTGGCAPVLNVGNVLSRLDLLGTYDLTGNTIFSLAKNEARNGAACHSSGVSFSWASATKPDETRVTNEWVCARSPAASTSNDAHQPPPAPFAPPTPPQRPGSGASTSAFGSSNLNSFNSSERSRYSLFENADDTSSSSDMGIVKWLKSANSSPLWLKAAAADTGNSMGWSGVFGVTGDSPGHEEAPVYKKHHFNPKHCMNHMFNPPMTA